MNRDGGLDNFRDDFSASTADQPKLGFSPDDIEFESFMFDPGTGPLHRPEESAVRLEAAPDEGEVAVAETSQTSQAEFTGHDVPLPSYLMGDADETSGIGEVTSEAAHAAPASATQGGEMAPAAPAWQWGGLEDAMTGPFTQADGDYEVDAVALESADMHGEGTAQAPPSATIEPDAIAAAGALTTGPMVGRRPLRSTGPLGASTTGPQGEASTYAPIPEQPVASAADVDTSMAADSAPSVATGERWSDNYLASLEDFSSVLLAIRAEAPPRLRPGEAEGLAPGDGAVQETATEAIPELEMPTGMLQEEMAPGGTLDPGDMQFEPYTPSESMTEPVVSAPGLPHVEEFLPAVSDMAERLDVKEATEQAEELESAQGQEPAVLEEEPQLSMERVEEFEPAPAPALPAESLPFWLRDSGDLEPSHPSQSDVELSADAPESAADVPTSSDLIANMPTDVVESAETEEVQLERPSTVEDAGGSVVADAAHQDHAEVLPQMVEDDYSDLPPIEPFDFTMLEQPEIVEELGFSDEELSGIAGETESMTVTADLNALADLLGTTPASGATSDSPVIASGGQLPQQPVAADEEEATTPRPEVGSRARTPSWTSTVTTNLGAAETMGSLDDATQDATSMRGQIPAPGRDATAAIPKFDEEQPGFATADADMAEPGDLSDTSEISTIEPFDFTALDLDEGEPSTVALDVKLIPGTGALDADAAAMGTAPLQRWGTGGLVTPMDAGSTGALPQEPEMATEAPAPSNWQTRTWLQDDVIAEEGAGLQAEEDVQTGPLGKAQGVYPTGWLGDVEPSELQAQAPYQDDLATVDVEPVPSERAEATELIGPEAPEAPAVAPEAKPKRGKAAKEGRTQRAEKGGLSKDRVTREDGAAGRLRETQDTADAQHPPTTDLSEEYLTPSVGDAGMGDGGTATGEPREERASAPDRLLVSTPLPALGGFDELREMVYRNPDDVSAHMALAAAYTQSGDVDAAFRVYRRLLKKRNLSTTVVQMVADELTDFEEEMQGQPRFHQVLGDLYMKQGMYREAIEEYNKIG